MIKLLLDRVRPLALKTAMEERLGVDAGLEKLLRFLLPVW